MRQVMGGLPKVESLVTILDGVEQSREQIGRQEKVEGMDWLYCERAGDSGVAVSMTVNNFMLRFQTYIFLAWEASGWT